MFVWALFECMWATCLHVCMWVQRPPPPLLRVYMSVRECSVLLHPYCVSTCLYVSAVSSSTPTTCLHVCTWVQCPPPPLLRVYMSVRECSVLLHPYCVSTCLYVSAASSSTPTACLHVCTWVQRPPPPLLHVYMSVCECSVLLHPYCVSTCLYVSAASSSTPTACLHVCMWVQHPPPPLLRVPRPGETETEQALGDLAVVTTTAGLRHNIPGVIWQHTRGNLWGLHIQWTWGAGCRACVEAPVVYWTLNTTLFSVGTKHSTTETTARESHSTLTVYVHSTYLLMTTTTTIERQSSEERTDWMIRLSRETGKEASDLLLLTLAAPHPPTPPSFTPGRCRYIQKHFHFQFVPVICCPLKDLCINQQIWRMASYLQRGLCCVVCQAWEVWTGCNFEAAGGTTAC